MPLFVHNLGRKRIRNNQVNSFVRFHFIQRYWASLFANVYALKHLAENDPFNISQAFYESILNQILGKYQSEELNELQTEFAIPNMVNPNLPHSIVVHIARQLYANFKVHVQALSERLVSKSE